MMLKEEFESITKGDFFEIQYRVLGNKKRKAPQDTSALKRFRSIGPPPPKTAEADEEGSRF